MKPRINKVAVLGSGVMGSGIAAHFANVNIPCLLLDIPAASGEPDAVVKKGFEAAKKLKPPHFYSKKGPRLIETGNFDRDFGRIRECDLVIEAVTERLDIKKAVWKKVDENRKAGGVTATNTSGLSLKDMVADCSADLRRNFLGMHFFNPPRYMKLLEIIPASETDPEVVSAMAEFAETILGKGVVVCRDTPNFIANRVGAYWMSVVMRTAEDKGYTVTETDLLTGTAIGHPKSATFRTADVVGLDTMAHVVKNLYDRLDKDEERPIFAPLPAMEKLIAQGALGAKSGRGFYQKAKSGEIDHLDLKTLAYVPEQREKFKSLDAAKGVEGLPAKLAAILSVSDRGSDLLWEAIARTFIYSVNRIGEICDTLVDIDNAMKWGWGHGLGPFEKIDALGVAACVGRMKKEGRPVPKPVEDFLAQGNASFYKSEKGRDFFYDFRSKSYLPVSRSPKILLLKNLKAQSKVVLENSGASLVDLGDGVACLEFHSKMNAIGPEIIALSNQALDEVERNFEGLVIGNQHDRAFSAGANLMLMLMAINDGEWDDVELLIRTFQNVNMRFRTSRKPVVAAVQGLALGGGCEVAMHADLVLAGAETYMGLVEFGAGLIPAGGGTKEMLLRAVSGLPENINMQLFLQKTLETLATARMSGSAEEARELGFLRPWDRVVVNHDYLLNAAKQAVLGLARSEYRPPLPQSDIPVTGREGYAMVRAFVNGMVEGRFISDHDAVIALKLGYILTGGNVSGRNLVSEQYLLDLEREAFMSLCGMRKSQERIKYILDTGKPLRN